MRKPGSKSQPAQEALTRDEWDFTGIPKEELWIAEIYEYSREFIPVRNAFNLWLDREVYWEAPYNNESVWDVLPTGRNVRDFVSPFIFPKQVTINGQKRSIAFSDIYDNAPDELAGHILMDLVPILGEWPKPYKVARKQLWFDEGLRIIDEDKQEQKNNKNHVWVSDSRLRPNQHREGLHQFSVTFDKHATLLQLKEEFGILCKPFLKQERRGRKKNQAPPIIRLKELSAHRLASRGYGSGKPYLSFAGLQIELQELADKCGEDSIVPDYADEAGLKVAGRKAVQHLKSYNRYMYWQRYSTEPIERPFQ